MFEKLTKNSIIKNTFFSVFLILLTAISFKLISDWSFPDTAWKISKDSKAELKKEEDPVLQKFIANRDGLSQVEMLLGSAKIKGEIEMKILDENCSNILREGKIKRTRFDSEKTYTFKFSQIENSKNKTFCFSIYFDGEKIGSKHPAIFVSNTQAPDGGSFKIPFSNEEIPNKSLSIRPGYQNLKWNENFTELNQRISQYKPFFLKHYYLWAISITFIILSISLVVILIRM